jgi:hypothetical protein
VLLATHGHRGTSTLRLKSNAVSGDSAAAGSARPASAGGASAGGAISCGTSPDANATVMSLVASYTSSCGELFFDKGSGVGKHAWEVCM